MEDRMLGFAQGSVSSGGMRFQFSWFCERFLMDFRSTQPTDCRERTGEGTSPLRRAVFGRLFVPTKGVAWFGGGLRHTAYAYYRGEVVVSGKGGRMEDRMLGFAQGSVSSGGMRFQFS